MNAIHIVKEHDRRESPAWRLTHVVIYLHRRLRTGDLDHLWINEHPMVDVPVEPEITFLERLAAERAKLQQKADALNEEGTP